MAVMIAYQAYPAELERLIAEANSLRGTMPKRRRKPSGRTSRMTQQAPPLPPGPDSPEDKARLLELALAVEAMFSAKTERTKDNTAYRSFTTGLNCAGAQQRSESPEAR